MSSKPGKDSPRGKRLGQHFLINKNVVADILRAGEVSKGDIVLEIGPGKGILTEALAQKAKKVIAVEKDKKLVEYLKEKMSEYLNIEIIHGDILKIFNFQFSIFKQIPKYKIIANIPYYITSRFLRLFLSNSKLRPKLMVLMIQREVAERIVARDGKESLLSLSVKAYGNPKIIKTVKRGDFFPPPKVDSAIIKVTIPDTNLRILTNDTNKTESILSLARQAFQQKRKMLRHSLGKNIPEKYQNKRPEELKLEDWKSIYLFLSSQLHTPEGSYKPVG